MSIEFRCPQCQRLLRVPEGSEGKQAQCPQCQAMVQVPTPGAAPAAPGASNPFAESSPAPYAAPSDNPYQAPASMMASQYSPAGAGVYPLVPCKMDLGDVLNRTWAIYQLQLGMMVLVGFVFMVMIYAFGFVVGMVVNVAMVAIGDEKAMIPLQLGAQPFQQLFQMWLGLGVFQYMLKMARGQPAEFTDIFTGFRYLLPAFLGALVLSAASLALALACFGPAGLGYLATRQEEVGFIMLAVGMLVYLPIAIFVWFSVLQYQPLIIDRGLGAIESLKMSNQIMSGNRLMFFAMNFVLGLVNVMGCLACGVGMFFTLGFYFLAQAVAYLVITGQPTADQLMRGAPPPVLEMPMPDVPPATA